MKELRSRGALAQALRPALQPMFAMLFALLVAPLAAWTPLEMGTVCAETAALDAARRMAAAMRIMIRP